MGQTDRPSTLNDSSADGATSVDGGEPADAMFGAFDDHPLIVWEPRSQTHTVTADGRVVGGHVVSMTGLGLPLVNNWHPSTLPDADRWEVRLNRGRISLGPVDGPPVYSQPATDEVLHWAMLAGDRCCLITGTGIGLVDPGLTRDALAEAAAEGRLVGGTVRLVRGSGA